MTLEELIALFKKVKEPREHKMTNSFGVYDAYKWIRKNKWLNINQPLTEHLFYTIIRRMNELLVNQLLQGRKVKLPCRMGLLELRKRPRKIEIVDGKLKTTLPINWDATLKLWAEEGKSKTLIRLESMEYFMIKYDKKLANYNNNCYYEFKPNRNFKLALKNKIKNNQIDAYLL